jgi:hypothetical protein
MLELAPFKEVPGRSCENMHQGEDMKDVKVDVRVNVDVDTASVVLLLASAAMGLFLYRQHKQEKAISHAVAEKSPSSIG